MITHSLTHYLLVQSSDHDAKLDVGDELSQLAARAQVATDARQRVRGPAAGSRRRDGDAADGGCSPQSMEDVYMEAMSLDARGRGDTAQSSSVSASAEWRHELDRIIGSLRQQLRGKNGGTTTPARDRLPSLSARGLEDSDTFVPVSTNSAKKYCGRTK